jgi:hypothetical protein
MSRSRLADDERSRVLMSCHGAFLALLVYKYFIFAAEKKKNRLASRGAAESAAAWKANGLTPILLQRSRVGQVGID